MINVIVPIIENVEKFEAFVNANAKRGVKFFVGIRAGLADKFKPKSKTVNVVKFADNAKREEILNALQLSDFVEGRILIARRPLTEQEFSKLTTSPYEIAVLKAKRNRFVEAWNRMLSAIIKKLFAFSYFQDISGICFDERMFQLISACSNLSMASRINKFVGVGIEEIEAEEKMVKKERNRAWDAIKLSLFTLFMFASIASVVLINVFTPTRVVFVMFEILWLVVAVTLWALALINFSRAVAVGDLRFARAKEII